MQSYFIILGHSCAFQKKRDITSHSSSIILQEALKSGMCDVIKIRLKRRITTRSGKGNQPLNINSCRTANFKARITKFQVELLFYFTSRCIPPLQTYFYDVTHDTNVCRKQVKTCCGLTQSSLEMLDKIFILFNRSL